MGKNSFILYMAVGFAMTMAVWGLMGGCSPEKNRPLVSEEPAPDPELVKAPPASNQKLPKEEVSSPKPSATVPAAAKPQAKPPAARPVAETRVVEHTVQKGETLWGISQTYRTTVEAIMELNQMKGMGIQVGQRLRVKTKAPVDLPVRAPAPAVEPAVPTAPVAPQPVVSAPVPVAQVDSPVAPERVAAPEPVPASTPAAVQAPAPAVAEKPAIKEELPPEPYTGELLTHEVKDGETLSSIATEYKTSKLFLQDVNGLTEKSELQVGQILLVPEKPKS